MNTNLYADDGLVEDAASGLYVKPRLSPKDVIVRDAAGRILYAVVGLHGTISRPRYEGPIYVSASDQQSALVQFATRFSHITFAEVWAGPAIGFFVHDNHGDSLSVGGERSEAVERMFDSERTH
jgi:hypothetical protein